MPEAERERDAFAEQRKLSDQLRSSMAKLEQAGDTRRSSKYGVSSDFSSQVHSESAAMEMCEKAMEALSTEFVEQLSAFQTATTPLESLAALEAAETCWQSESRVICHFDSDGEEVAFLGRMRQQTFELLSGKLETSAEECAANPSDENVALCLGVMGVMDSILGEMGRSEDEPERQRLRKIARAFA